MLETNYILNLGQLLKIAYELKRYLQQKLKLEKIQNVSRTIIEKTQNGSKTIRKIIQNVSKIIIEKQVSSSVPKVGIIAITIDKHMVVIQIQIKKNT